MVWGHFFFVLELKEDYEIEIYLYYFVYKGDHFKTTDESEHCDSLRHENHTHDSNDLDNDCYNTSDSNQNGPEHTDSDSLTGEDEDDRKLVFSTKHSNQTYKSNTSYKNQYHQNGSSSSNGNNLQYCETTLSQMDYEQPAVRTKLYVTNFPEDMDQEEMKQLFNNYGHVLECTIMWNQYAFVHFGSYGEAEKALIGIKGVQYKGCKISVQWSTSAKYQQPKQQATAALGINNGQKLGLQTANAGMQIQQARGNFV